MKCRRRLQRRDSLFPLPRSVEGGAQVEIAQGPFVLVLGLARKACGALFVYGDRLMVLHLRVFSPFSILQDAAQATMGVGQVVPARGQVRKVNGDPLENLDGLAVGGFGLREAADLRLKVLGQKRRLW